MMILKYQLKLLDAGYGHEALEVENIVLRNISDPKDASEVGGTSGIFVFYAWIVDISFLSPSIHWCTCLYNIIHNVLCLFQIQGQNDIPNIDTKNQVLRMLTVEKILSEYCDEVINGE